MYLILLGSILTLHSCKWIFDPDDDPPCGSAEMKLPEIIEGAMFRYDPDPNGFIKPMDTVEFYPGQTKGSSFKGPFERDLSYMKVRWTFQDANLFYNGATGEPYPKEFVEEMPSYSFAYGKTFTKDLPDSEIGTGDIISSYQAVIFNKCGETRPIKGHIKLINSGNVIQNLKNLTEVARLGHIQAFYKNKIYILFGQGGENNYSYDINTKEVTLLPPISLEQFNPKITSTDDSNALIRTLYGYRGNGPFTTYAQ